MLWSFTICSAVHLFTNGDLGSVLLFGSFGLYSLFSMWSLNRRGAKVPHGPLAIERCARGRCRGGRIWCRGLHAPLFAWRARYL